MKKRVKCGTCMLIAASTLLACSNVEISAGDPLDTTPIWVTSGFDAPESVLISPDASFMFVSNVNGEGADKDGNGYISKLGLDGEIIEKSWASGLNGPKGMAIWDQHLYVSDIDHLTQIDLTTGQIVETISVPGSRFLNDATFVPNLGVLVSDSATQSIFLYDGESLSKWMENEAFSGINGLLPEGDKVLVTTMDAGHLLSVDMGDKSIHHIATGMKNADGVRALKDGSYLVSSWPGQLHHVAGETARILLDTTESEIYMNDFTIHGDVLYVPNWQPGSVRAFKVN